MIPNRHSKTVKSKTTWAAATKNEDEEASPEEKRSRARKLKHAAEEAKEVAEDMDSDSRGANPRAKHVKDAADDLEKTADVVESEAEDTSKTD